MAKRKRPFARGFDWSWMADASIYDPQNDRCRSHGVNGMVTRVLSRSGKIKIKAFHFMGESFTDLARWDKKNVELRMAWPAVLEDGTILRLYVWGRAEIRRNYLVIYEKKYVFKTCKS